jgi:hypothetical protein
MENLWYSIKGSTNDCTTCDICGREELKKTVVLNAKTRGSDEIISVIYAGTDCASRLIGRPQHEVKQRTANADRAKR